MWSTKPQKPTQERRSICPHREWISLRKSCNRQSSTNNRSDKVSKSYTLPWTIPDLDKTPRVIKIYDVLRKTYRWPQIVLDVHDYVFKCKLCRWHRPSQKHQRWLQLFLPNRPLEIVAIDILGPQMKTKQKNRFNTVKIDRFSKLTLVFPLPKTIAQHVVLTVFENWIMPYGIPHTRMTNNGPRIVSKVSTALRASTGTKLVRSTEYCPQANSQMERFIKKLIARHCQYINEHQTGWHNYELPPNYVYNTRVHCTTKYTFSLGFRQQPLGAITEKRTSTPGEYIISLPVQAKSVALDYLKVLKKSLNTLCKGQKSCTSDTLIRMYYNVLQVAQENGSLKTSLSTRWNETRTRLLKNRQRN